MLLNSLAVKTLWKMSLRIALIILLVTAASYFHLSRSIETQTKETILRYTKEREARERISFDLARQNHSTLASEFLREYRGLLKDPKLESRYQSLVRKYSDGVLRNKDAGFDGTKVAGIFISRPDKVNRAAMAKVVASYNICNRFGVGYHHLFQDTYFTFLDINSIVVYWPEQPHWVHDAGADLKLDAEEYSSVSSPENDPHRATVWTGLFYDKVSRI